MKEISNKYKGIESERNAREPEIKTRDQIWAQCQKRKGSNLGTMPENLNQNKGIKSRRDAEEPEIKGSDQIWAQCQKTWNKRNGSNLGAMPKNTE